MEIAVKNLVAESEKSIIETLKMCAQEFNFPVEAAVRHAGLGKYLKETEDGQFVVDLEPPVKKTASRKKLPKSVLAKQKQAHAEESDGEMEVLESSEKPMAATPVALPPKTFSLHASVEYEMDGKKYSSAKISHVHEDGTYNIDLNDEDGTTVENVEAKELKEITEKIPLPFLPSLVDPLLCQGLSKNRQLYTQCLYRKGSGSDYCNKCNKRMAVLNKDIPEHGNIKMRLEQDLFHYVAPDGSKQVLFKTVLDKDGISKEKVLAFAASKGIELEEAHFLVEEPKKKKVVAKKAVVVVDPPVDSPVEAAEVQENKSLVVIEGNKDELFAKLVKSAEDFVPIVNGESGDMFASALVSKKSKKVSSTKRKADKQEEEKEEEKEKEEEQEEPMEACTPPPTPTPTPRKKSKKTVVEEDASEEEEQEEEKTPIVKKRIISFNKLVAKEDAEFKKPRLDMTTIPDAPVNVQISPLQTSSVVINKKSTVLKKPEKAEERDETMNGKCEKIQVDGLTYFRSLASGLIYDFDRYMNDGKQIILGTWDTSKKRIKFYANPQCDSELSEEEYDEEEDIMTA